MARRAVVLFNLGGPDCPEAIQPFLFNLFRDPAIISLPNPLRWFLARRISAKRAPVARQIYANIGGRSPLLDLTRNQANALQSVLGEGCRVFVCMRYWHPMSEAVAKEVAAWQPDEIVLLPLYPQFSTTTTGSSLADWHRHGLDVPTATIGCYPTQEGLVRAQAEAVAVALDGLESPRLLFSAHGLPEVVIERGDPYQWQVEQSAAAVVAALGRDGLDWSVCYQSRVGPRRWIGPSTDDEIRRAGRDGVPLVVLPIAFVSEHSETLVELDIEYRTLAESVGVPAYVRVPALGTNPAFIDGLAALVRAAKVGPACSQDGGRLCPGKFSRCICVAEET
jgi:protoporphyrin/coproporphyrin ferrochelatase